MDRSMDKINVIKLLLFLLIFLVIAISMILFLIVPNVKEYRLEQGKYNNAFVHKMRVENVYNDRVNELGKLNKDNIRALTSFQHKFSAQDFIKYSSKFFTKVSLNKLEKKGYKKEFVEYKLEVSTNLKSPTNFYAFLDGLNRYDNIIQTNFPIAMQSDGVQINSTFTIDVYDINISK